MSVDEKAILKLYDKKLSDYRISKELGISTWKVQTIRRKHNLPAHYKGNKEKTVKASRKTEGSNKKKFKKYTNLILKIPIELKEKIQRYADSEGIPMKVMAIKSLNRGLYSRFIPRPDPKEPVLVDYNTGQLEEVLIPIIKEDRLSRETEKDTKRY